LPKIISKPQIKLNFEDFKPKFYKYLDYLVIGDSLAIEIIKSNKFNSNFSECSNLTDIFCQKDMTVRQVISKIKEIPRNVNKVISILGFDEHIAKSFHLEKFDLDYRNLIHGLKNNKILDIIVTKIPPRKTKMLELQYWRLLNTINCNIHTMCNEEKIRYVNFDHVQMKFDKTRKYDVKLF